jgi:hypothetical protein
MKFQAREQWDIEYYHHDPYQLRYREVLTRKKGFGEWRKVNKKKFWKVEPGKTSGLPKNLFAPLNEAITGTINKISRDRRKLPDLRRRTRSVVINAAAKTFPKVTAEEESKTLIKYILHHKPFMHFLIVDWHEHGPEEYVKHDQNGHVMKNRWGKPQRDLGRLAHQIRKDKDSGLYKLEHESKATLRWVVCFLADGTVWLVPAKSKKE